MNLLVTGSAGFIGSAFVRLLFGKSYKKNFDFRHFPKVTKVVSLDNLGYAASLDNLDLLKNEKAHTFFKGDIRDEALVEAIVREHKIDAIVNFAAESHVDRSIEGSRIFAETNILGTLSLLEVARKNKLKFLQVSTDEVYGTLGDTGSFTEETPLAPNSPYSASKAGADFFVRAYVHTHALDAVITRCTNNYGPHQFPEKFLPVAITSIFRGKKIPVYGTGKNVRDWLHVEDHSAGIALALTKGRSGEVYNFGGYGELTNLQVVDALARAFKKQASDVYEFVPDRKGHDWRYSISPDKSRSELGWKPQWSFDEGLQGTIEWYQTHEDWWKSKL